jgi:hypothetical protein
MVEGAQSITSDVDVQSITSITLKEHNKVETPSRQEREAPSWLEIIIPKQKHVQIGIQSLQSIQGFFIPTNYLQTNLFDIEVKKK